jgi:Zn ribbon nucleic-acid-binding protein
MKLPAMSDALAAESRLRELLDVASIKLALAAIGARTKSERARHVRTLIVGPPEERLSIPRSRIAGRLPSFQRVTICNREAFRDDFSNGHGRQHAQNAQDMCGSQEGSTIPGKFRQQRCIRAACHCIKLNGELLETSSTGVYASCADDLLPRMSARTECPDCHSEDILDLRHFLKSRSYDYFRCHSCNCWWMVPSDSDQPATRVILGNRKTSEDASELRPPQRQRVCPKCGSQANLLDVSILARVDYFRCVRCSHVYAVDPEESIPIDVTVRDDDKAS